MTRPPVTPQARATDLLEAVDCYARDTRFESTDAEQLAQALRYAVEGLDRWLRRHETDALWIESQAHLIAEALRPGARP
jgi:hypothetical protein